MIKLRLDEKFALYTVLQNKPNEERLCIFAMHIAVRRIRLKMLIY